LSAISASKIYAGIKLRRVGVTGDTDIEPALTSIRVGEATERAFDYDGAIELAAKYSWDLFSDEQDPTLAFRQTIEAFVRKAQPSWLRLFPFGRDHVLGNISGNERQCFDIAGLAICNGPEVVSWWDRLADVARQDRDKRLIELGREGERKSIVFEQKLLSGTGLELHWVAIDDNNAGYDIRSWRAGGAGWGTPEPKFIESKSASYTPRFFLSRNEWKFAERHQNSWELQLWVADRDTPVRLTHESLCPHMPMDGGHGQWRQVEITLPDSEEE